MQIKNAILHILKNDGNPTMYSEKELDIDSEVCEAFIAKHVKKLMNNHAAREATFAADSAVYQAVTDYRNGTVPFKVLSYTLAERLSDILNQHTDIPPADLLITRFDVKHDSYLAVFKLNYTECITHRTDENDNQLVLCRSVLPFTSGKVEEACLIPFDPMVLRLLEKPQYVDGDDLFYFSELFLECETSLSRKETAQIISEVTDEFIQEYCDMDIKTQARVKHALNEEAEEEDGLVSMDNVAARAFGAELKDQYVHTLREAGIVEDLPLGAKFVRQQFGTQRIKADNGVEIKFPAELAGDEDKLEIRTLADGTLTVILKGLRVE